MVDVKIVEENPNPKVLSVDVDQSFLKVLGKVVVSRKGTFKEYSPFAKAVFKKHPNVKSLTFLKNNDDTTRVTFFLDKDVTKQIMGGEKKLKKKQELGDLTNLPKFLKKYIKKDKDVIINDQALKEKEKISAIFNPENNVQKVIVHTIKKHVAPKATGDGGDFQVADIRFNQDNTRVDVDVYLLGACDGCSQSETGTMEGARQALTAVFEQVRQKLPGYGGLQLGDVKKVDFEDIAFE